MGKHHNSVVRRSMLKSLVMRAKQRRDPLEGRSVFEYLEERKLLSGAAPVAVDDAFATPEDTQLIVTAPGVLSNDTDAEGDPLSGVIVDSPSHGTVVLNDDGSFTYNPSADFNGTDSFTYKANDGSDDSNVGTVNITVTPTNDAPVANNDSYRTPVNLPFTVNGLGVLANDTDADGDGLTAVLVAGPSHGTLTLNPDGSFTYAPEADFNGTDSFTYKANDGIEDGNTATASITVNTAPVASGDVYVTAKDVPLTVAPGGVLANDADPDGGSLSAILVSGPSHGSLTLNADGSFSYTPDSGFAGSDSFTYQANDGIDNSGPALVTIKVNAPPIANDDNYTTNEDTPLTVAASGVLANDTDPNGDTLTAILVSGPSHGTLTLNADGSFTYTPEANFAGSDSFTYKANDGTIDSSNATVSITITPVNDAPVARDDSFSTTPDSPLTTAAPGVLANDTDIDGDTLTAVLVDSPSHGGLTLNPDGSFTYTPDQGFTGVDTFTYRANDGTADSNLATVTITVNTVPVSVDDAFSTDEDTPLTISAPGILSNDVDADGHALTTILVSQPQHGTLAFNNDGSFTYTPNADFTGTDGFTYRSNDGLDDSNLATVSITVNPVNDAPVSEGDSYATDEDTPLVVAGPGVLANDHDVDGDVLAAVLVDGPSHGRLTLNADGSFTYTPDGNFNGMDSFSYKVNDGTADSGVAVVSITINAVNDAPVAHDRSFSMAEDTVLTIAGPGVLVDDSDVEGDALTAVLVTGPENGTLSLNADGSFVYTPAANFNGLDSFTYAASDATTTGNAATVRITVTPVNDAPVANNDSFTVTQDQPLTVAGLGVVGNDTDVDGDTLTATLVDGPLNGTLTLNPDGSFVYQPATGFKGMDSFTYQISDGQVSSGVAKVLISVTPPVPVANRTPTASNITVTRKPGSTAPIDVLARSSDPDGDALAISIASRPSHGRAIVHNNGTPLDFSDDSIEYLPDTDYFGTDSFTYTLSDGRGGTSTAKVTVNVSQIGLSPNPFDPRKTDLIVLGTTGNDVIRLIPSGKNDVRVVVNGRLKGIFNPTGRVIADGLAGNDLITAQGLKRSVQLYGGSGNDRLIGGLLPSQLYGGAGNDTLQGGSKRDLLDGGTGKNILR